MNTAQSDPIAVVGIAAIMPQAPNGETFWANLKKGVYSITDVPPERWDPAVYYDADRTAVDKTYSRIGGWVRDFEWNPIAWRLPVPPKVAEQMDQGQRWAVSAARSALHDAGYPDWKVDGDRVAVIFGNAIGGEKHYLSSMRIRLPEMLRKLQESPTLQQLAPDVQRRIIEETHALYREQAFDITEDTMPGELSNVMAGRVANLFNLRGPNFTTDAACASALAAIDNAVMGLLERRYDAAVRGGFDRNMGVDAFVKVCKIGALSATGTRPFDAGADGFVMGEGAAVFVLKRLRTPNATATGSTPRSSGSPAPPTAGQGHHRPNPIGQRSPCAAPGRTRRGHGHGQRHRGPRHSTPRRGRRRTGQPVEVFASAGLAPRSVALGSVKSNIGHLKAAAGAAGLFKMVRSLHEGILVPSLHFVDPNPGVDWDTSAFAVNTTLREWPQPRGGIRRAGVSAFGFGGTNFHVVVEEHVPGRHKPRPTVHASAQVPRVSPQPRRRHRSSWTSTRRRRPRRRCGEPSSSAPPTMPSSCNASPRPATPPAPVRCPRRRHRTAPSAMPRSGPPSTSAPPTNSPANRQTHHGLQTGNPAILKMARQQGAFIGRGPAPRSLPLHRPGLAVRQHAPRPGRQRTDRRTDFAEADRVMTPCSASR